jgi:DNA repair protein RadA/Sms
MSTNSIFVCQQCGNEYSKWLGKCTACNAWNSLVETTTVTGKGKKSKSSGRSSRVVENQTQKLTDIKASEMKRIATGISELDRALGGGLVSGQVVLIAGEPGIGKSTLLLQLADNLKKTFYVSGEESSTQVAIRAERLGIKNKNIDFLDSSDVDDVIEQLNTNKQNLDVIIVD